MGTISKTKPTPKFEEDDTVAFVANDHHVGIGLVSEVYAPDASDNESDNEDEDLKLKPGQISVELYPSGRESVMEANSVKLIDRALLMGETVYCPKLDKIGFVYNVHTTCDAVDLPMRREVVKNITDDRFDFIQKFGSLNSETKYVVLDKWIGVVSNVAYKLYLLSIRRYKCSLIADDESYGIKDALVRRVRDSSFDNKQWYPGQVLNCKYPVLRKAKWAPHTPGALVKRVFNRKWKSHYMKFVVQSVDVHSLTVRWMTAMGGSETINPPSATLYADKIKKVRLLPYVDHQFLQIGDRIAVNRYECTASLEKTVKWRRNLLDQIKAEQKRRSDDSGSRKRGDPLKESAKSSSSGSSSLGKDGDNDDSNWVDCNTTDDDIKEDGKCKSNARKRKQSECCSSKSVDNDQDEKTHCDSVPPSKEIKLTRTSRRPIMTCRKSSAGVNPLLLKWKQPPKPKSRKEEKRRKWEELIEHVKRSEDDRYLEAIYVRSTANVIWQDGTKSENVPTHTLSYAELDLDEHVFFPGSFVRLQEGKDDLWPRNGYGVVASVNPASKMALVSWYEIEADGEISYLIPIKPEPEEISIFDLVTYNEYNFASGNLVSATKSVCIGQVLYVNKEGMVVVCWSNGKIDEMYPIYLCKLLSDDAWSEHDDDEEDENSDVDNESVRTGESDGISNDDSWSTVDEETNADCSTESASDNEIENEVESEDDFAKYDVPKRWFDDMPKEQRDKMIITSRLKNLPVALRDIILDLRKSENSNDRVRIKMAAAILRFYRIFCIMQQNISEDKPLSLNFNADLKSCIAKLKGWLKLVSPVTRRPRLDKLIADIEEPALPKQSELSAFIKKEIRKIEKIKTKVEKICSESSYSSTASSSSTFTESKTKSDGGLSETFHLFVKQVSQVFSRLPRLTTPRSANESTQLDRLIKEIMEHPMLKEVFDRSGSGTAMAATDSKRIEALVGIVSNSAGEHLTNSQNSGEPRQASELIQQLVEAQMAKAPDPKQGVQNCVDYMEFMASSMSAILKNRSLISSTDVNFHSHRYVVEDTPSGITQIAKVDVIMVTALIIFQLSTESLLESFSLRRKNKPEADGEDDGDAMDIDDDNNDGNILEEVQDDEDDEDEEDDEEDGEEQEDEDETNGDEDQYFELVEEEPETHVYFSGGPIDIVLPKFMKAVHADMKMLRTSLVKNIFVKAFEKRIDLFSLMIRGASGTPYKDGLFLFDIKLRQNYPQEPPVVFYKSFASEKLNPNLYEDGKVCISLLGTWSGKDSEIWNPGSNLRQVILSIQGLILNAEPYYNEAGYEARRGVPEYAERSRCYNEMVVVRNLENLINIASRKPSPFENEIEAHMRKNGRKIVQRMKSWMTGESTCEFPLQPVSRGCCLSVEKQLKKLEDLLDEEFS